MNIGKYFDQTGHNTKHGYIKQDNKYYITNMYSAIMVPKEIIKKYKLEKLDDELLNCLDYKRLININMSFKTNKIVCDNDTIYIDDEIHNDVIVVFDNTLDYSSVYRKFNDSNIIFNETLITNILNLLNEIALEQFYFYINGSKMLIYNQNKDIQGFMLGIQNNEEENNIMQNERIINKNTLLLLLTDTKNLLVKWEKSDKSTEGKTVIETKRADGTIYNLKQVNPDHYELINPVTKEIIIDSTDIEAREQIKVLWTKATINLLTPEVPKEVPQRPAAPDEKPPEETEEPKPAANKKSSTRTKKPVTKQA